LWTSYWVRKLSASHYFRNRLHFFRLLHKFQIQKGDADMQNLQTREDFESLAALPEFSRFSEILTKLTGVAMSLQSPDGEIRIRYGDGMQNPLCRMIRTSKLGSVRCTACDIGHSQKAGMQGKAILYKCHSGFLDMIIPIFVRGVHVASISSGQILPEPPTEEALAKLKTRLAYLKLDDDTVSRAYWAAPYMPKEKVKHMVSLLETFAVQLCESLSKIRELESRLERNELHKAKEYVAKHFTDPNLGLIEVASYAGLSPAHFSHVFKKSVGISFTRFIQRVRVDEAKQLLMRSEKSITEICFCCGFNSVAHFIRVFRSQEHTTPSGYKLSARAPAKT